MRATLTMALSLGEVVARGCLEPGVDLWGSDIRRVPDVPSPEECQRACIAEPGCAYFSWISEAHPWTDGRRSCFLKAAGASTDRRSNLHVTSGPRECPVDAPVCVVKEGASSAAVCNALKWACGQGGVACGDDGASCSSAVLVSNANRAFSAYYIQKDGAGHACDFGGVATLALDKMPPVPTHPPTSSPSNEPTAAPTALPTARPTASPTASPSALPTASPTSSPTISIPPSPTSPPFTAPPNEATPAPTTSRRAACPVNVDEQVADVTLKSSGRFPEISGIAVSGQRWLGTDEVAWVHNDAGGGKYLGLFSLRTGQQLLALNLDDIPSVKFRDTEDISLGPCDPLPYSSSSTTPDFKRKECIFIADVGDNEARGARGRSGRTDYRFYKLEEPDLSAYATTFEEVVEIKVAPTQVDVLRFEYPDDAPTPFADCEAVFVDPVGDREGGEGGDIYLVTKWNSDDRGNARVFRYPASSQDGSTTVQLELVGGVSSSDTWTRADMSRDGGLAVLGGYGRARFWTREEGDSVGAMLSGPRCSVTFGVPSGPERQFEAVALSPFDVSMKEVSECTTSDWCNAVVHTKLTRRRSPPPPTGGGSSDGCGGPFSSAYPECQGRMEWMYANWRNNPIYAENGVDGGACSIQKFLFHEGGYCPLPASTAPTTPPPTMTPPSRECVVKNGADVDAVCGALSWACGSGVSCTRNQRECGEEVLINNANRAWTVYYESKDYAAHACDFGGLAVVKWTSGGDGSGDGEGFEQIWADEFDGDKLDLNKWSYETGGGGWGNGEKQVYTNRPENAFVQDGALHVRLVKGENGEWTSARLNTYGKFSFALGRVEARVRLERPTPGPFPAVWMLADGIFEGTRWPLCGEIDIFEYNSIWGYVPATLHYADHHGGNARSFHGTLSDPSEWHVYAMEWDTDHISFFQDGTLIGRQDRPTNPTQQSWPYTEDNLFFLLINNAMQPSWGEAPSESLQENTLVVDYVRVAQRV